MLFFIILFSIISFIFIFFILGFFLITFRNKKQFRNYNRGVLSFDVDREKSRVRLVDFIPNVSHQLTFFLPKNLANGFWVPLKEFVEIFGLNKDSSFISDLRNLSPNNNVVDFNKSLNEISYIENRNLEKVEGNFKLIYEDENLQHCILNWLRIEENILKSAPFISRKGLIKNGSSYNVFFGFNIVKNHTENSKALIQGLIKMLRFTKFTFFQSRWMLVIVFEASTLSRLEKKVQSFLEKYEKIGKKTLFLDYYFEGLGYVEAKNVNSEESINKVLRRLQYSISKSIIIKEVFGFKLRNVDFAEFDTFRKNILNFYLNLENKKIDFDYLRILVKNKGNRNVSRIAYPRLEGEENLERITLNKNNENLILDTFFEKYFLQSNLFKNTFYFLNDYLLLKHHEKLIFSSNIFILKIVDVEDLNKLIDIFKKLKKEKVRYGLYVEEINENLLSFVDIVEPNYLFISSKISQHLNKTKNIFNLIDLANLSKIKKTIMIYENPDFDINEKQTELILLKYFYRTKK